MSDEFEQRVDDFFAGGYMAAPRLAVCEQPGCGKKLSILNKEALCYTCQEKRRAGAAKKETESERPLGELRLCANRCGQEFHCGLHCDGSRSGKRKVFSPPSDAAAANLNNEEPTKGQIMKSGESNKHVIDGQGDEKPNKPEALAALGGFRIVPFRDLSPLGKRGKALDVLLQVGLGLPYGQMCERPCTSKGQAGHLLHRLKKHAAAQGCELRGRTVGETVYFWRPESEAAQ